VSLSKDIKHIVSFTLPPKEAIAYLEKKGYKLTFNYKELEHQAHHKAFTVAKIQRLDLLSDIKESLHKALKEGKSFNNWQKEIKPTLIKKGWWGKIEAINKKTGEVKNITVNARRLQTIFYTNSRVAYQVQKAKKFYEDENITYLRYIAILDNAVRPSHRAIHGVVLPKTHPFWQKNFPPNGWNCRCRVSAVSSLSEARYKNKIKESLSLVKQHPLIADKDWAYDIREGREGMFFDKFSGTDIETKADSNYVDFNLPSADKIKEQNLPPAPPKLPKAKDKKEALEVLKKEILKDKKEVIVKTPITEILINETLLKHSIDDNKDNREVFAKYIIPALTEPDEVWAHKSKGKSDNYYKKRYRFIKIFKEKKENLIAVSELKRDGSIFWTFFKTSSLKKINDKRVGVLMWFRENLFRE